MKEDSKNYGPLEGFFVIGFYAKILPELHLFPTLGEKATAVRRARNEVRWDSSLSTLIIPLFVIVLVGVGYVLLIELFKALNVLTSVPLVLTSVPLFCVMSVGVRYVLRNKYRISLRKQLVEQGIPICMACGYDFTGNSSGVCPECAQKI